MRRLLLLITICAGLSLAACESDSPVQPLEPGTALFSLNGSSGFTASAISASEIDLGWPPRSSPPVNGFQVFRSTTGETGSFSLIATTAATTTSYADIGLTASTTYCYKVRSFKTNGRNTTYSAYSEPACATTNAIPPLLAPPTGTDTKPQGSTSIAVAWSLAPGTAAGFRVERLPATYAGPWDSVTTTLGSTRSYVDVGRLSEVVVCYRIVALYAEGESAPSNVDCTAPPIRPTNLVASPASDAVTLTWEDRSWVEDQYEVQRAVDGATFTTLASLPANSTTYRDAGVSVGRTYWYRVQARKDGGPSDNSNTVTVTVPPAGTPYGPSDTDAKPGNSSTIQVRWTDNSANEDGFRVEQASSVNGPWTPVGSAAANATSRAVSVASDQRLCYRVVAVNAAGDSPPSAPDCTAAPAAPTNLVAAPVSDGIAVSWRDNSSVEFGYVLQRSTDGATFLTIARLYANTSSFRQPGVGSSTRYSYRVVATRDGGLSDYSNSASSVGACTVASDTEDCSNGLDDNCDGVVDGLDPVCGELVDCNANPCGSGTICVSTGGTLEAYCQSSCADGYRNSDESDIDCGGGCGSCQVDQQCWGSYDCASNNCVYAQGAFMGVCQPAGSPP